MNVKRIMVIPIILLFSLSISNGYAIRQDDSYHISDSSDSKTSSSPTGIDLDVTYISREPRYKWNATKQWPDPGESVTFKAHIINKGTIGSGGYLFEWRIDNQIVAVGSADSITQKGEMIQEFDWEWQPGRHHVSFEVDPQNLISETAETNNKIIDATDALTIGFWVEETVYDDFNNIENGAGTYSWEDWAQRIIQKMNWMFEYSKYPFAPNGVLTRVRLDNISIVPDGTLFNQGAWHAPYDTIYDGRWGFSFEEYGNGCQCCPTEMCFDVPWWVIHELGHYLFGRVDIYGLDIQGGDVNILDEDGELIAGTPLLPYIYWDVVHYASRIYDVMHVPDPYSLFSDFHTYSLNLDWPPGQRTHSGWDYINKIPSETILRVLDNNNQPIPNIEVSVYQALPGDGSSGPYSQDFDNTPDIVGVSDSQGLFSLDRNPFSVYDGFGITNGIILVKLKNLDTGIYKYISIEVTDLNLAYWRGQSGTYIHNIHFPSGPKKLAVSENSIEFTAIQGINPIPKSIDVSILGEGVQYWSVESPSVTWLRTIPAPEIATSYSEYPPGLLTFIIDSEDFPIGTYDTSISVHAGDIIDSPQIVTVTLDVKEAKLIYLPIVSTH